MGRNRMTASNRKKLVATREAATATNESASATTQVGSSHYNKIESEDGQQLHDSEGLSGPFPGGPTYTSVIKSFDTHVAHLIWRNYERPILCCLQHTSKWKA